MRDAVIVEAVRTPIGKRKGSLADVHAVELSAHVLRSIAQRTGIDPAIVDDVYWGNVNSVGMQTGNIGRMAVLGAGWPESVPGLTVDRQCGSSQQTISMAAASVISGQADVIVAGGVEMMTSVPLGSSNVPVPAIPPARPVSATPRSSRRPASTAASTRASAPS